MKVNEIILSEMSDERKVVKKRIVGLSSPVILHLVKVLKWRDVINLNKHIENINDWIEQIQKPRFKKGNQRPSQRDYYAWIYGHMVERNETAIFNIIQSLKSDYGKLKSIRDDDEVDNIIKHVVYQLSYELPTNENIDIRTLLEPFLEKRQ